MDGPRQTSEKAAMRDKAEGPVHLVQIDPAHAQALEAGVDRRIHCTHAPARGRGHVLGGDHRRTRIARAQPANHALRFAEAIKLGGVQKVGAALHRRLVRGLDIGGLLAVVIVPVGLVAPLPGAHADRTGLQVRRADASARNSAVSHAGRRLR